MREYRRLKQTNGGLTPLLSLTLRHRLALSKGFNVSVCGATNRIPISEDIILLSTTVIHRPAISNMEYLI